MNRKTIEKAADNYAHEEWPSGLYGCVSSDSFIAGARYVLDHLCRLPWNEAIKELAEYAEEKNKIAAVQAAEERMKLKIKQIQENEQSNQVSGQTPQ